MVVRDMDLWRKVGSGFIIGWQGRSLGNLIGDLCPERKLVAYDLTLACVCVCVCVGGGWWSYARWYRTAVFMILYMYCLYSYCILFSAPITKQKSFLFSENRQLVHLGHAGTPAVPRVGLPGHWTHVLTSRTQWIALQLQVISIDLMAAGKLPPGTVNVCSKTTSSKWVYVLVLFYIITIFIAMKQGWIF